jgi:hypothetical protein
VTYLEATVVDPHMVESLKEVRLAAKMVYGFIGGDSRKLGTAIWKVGRLIESIEHWEEEIDEEDSDAVSA